MNLQKIKSQVISVVLNRGLIAFFSLLLEVIFIKYLTVEEKGEIFYIRSNIELFAYIFTFGLGMSIVHFRSKYGSKYDRQIIKWILFSFLALIMSSYVVYNIDIIERYLFIKKDYFFPATLASIFTLVSLYLQKIYLSDDDVKLHNRVIFYNKIVVSMVLLVIAFFIEHHTVYYLILSIPLSMLLVNIYFFMKLKLNIFAKDKNSDFLQFNINVYFYEVLFQFKTKFDNFLVLYFLGVSAVGIFSVAINFGALVLIVSSSVSLILLKELSSLSNIEYEAIKILLKKYIIMMIGITILSIFFVYMVVYFFGENKFEKSFYVYCFYSIDLLLFSVISFIRSYFNSLKKTQLQLYSLLISYISYIFIFFIDVNNIYEIILISIFSNVLQIIYFYRHMRL